VTVVIELAEDATETLSLCGVRFDKEHTIKAGHTEDDGVGGDSVYQLGDSRLSCRGLTCNTDAYTSLVRSVSAAVMRAKPLINRR
jgi:hypothetical protein